MRYHIKKINTVKKQKKHAILTAKRQSGAICPYTALAQSRVSGERINIDGLFADRALPSGKKKRRRKHCLKLYARRVMRNMKKSSYRLRKRLSEISAKERHDKKWLAFLSGALCGTAIVTLTSAVAVLLILFGTFLMPHKKITVPSLVGQTYSTDSIDDRFEVEVTYKNSDTHTAGTVISQTPSAGTVRKYYSADDKCKLSLTVSTGKHYYTVTELTGLDARDAILTLRNEGVLINTVYEYSEAPQGTVISTSPAAGYAVYDGEPVVLRISLGKQKLSVSVPNLYSLTEAQASELLAQKGLKLGEISYAVSSQPSGVIIAQQYAPYSKVEIDTAVNVTVSIGNEYEQRTVPDLYGLTVDEARARLAEYGLVLGGIYTVASGAPKGTVVAQTPIEGTPLTSSITSVDIFISS